MKAMNAVALRVAGDAHSTKGIVRPDARISFSPLRMTRLSGSCR